jgi:hypothetical protein
MISGVVCTTAPVSAKPDWWRNSRPAATLVKRLAFCRLPVWLLEDIKAGPSGYRKGGHGWIFWVPFWLYRYRLRHRLTDDGIRALLRVGTEGYRRPISSNEIDEAIQNAKAAATDPRHKTQTVQCSKASLRTLGGKLVGARKPRPDFDFTAIDKIVRAGVSLTEVSPTNLKTSPVTTNQVIHRLFGAGYLCVGLTADKPQIRSITEWVWSNALSSMAYIVPSRMTKWIGLNKQGRTSVRCEDTVGPREFLVIESDIAKDKPSWKPHIEAWERDGITIGVACASILWHLAQFAPLVLAVHSGGKSIHGWFACRGVPEGKLRRFMEYAVSLGADHHMWSISQWTRMPGGRRENGARQPIVYWDPATIEKWRTR